MCCALYKRGGLGYYPVLRPGVWLQLGAGAAAAALSSGKEHDALKALGRHIVAELSHCNPEVLTDLDRVQAAMIQAALVARAEIREVAFHRFYPTGVSGVVVLAESHLAIHTWPDLGYAAIDVYTCGDTAEPWRACRYLAEQFGCLNMHTTVMDRGIPAPAGDFGHRVTVVESREQMLTASSA